MRGEWAISEGESDWRQIWTMEKEMWPLFGRIKGFGRKQSKEEEKTSRISLLESKNGSGRGNWENNAWLYQMDHRVIVNSTVEIESQQLFGSGEMLFVRR